jgi:hypothetical protein
MRLSVNVGDARYPHMMTSEEINRALRHARALTAMSPPMAVARPLAIFVGQLLTELWNRDEAEEAERQVTDFSGKELRAARDHAKALKLLGPRQQIQVGVIDYMFAVMAELESRSTARGNHAARVAKGLTDACPAGTKDC